MKKIEMSLERIASSLKNRQISLSVLSLAHRLKLLNGGQKVMPIMVSFIS